MRLLVAKALLVWACSVVVLLAPPTVAAENAKPDTSPPGAAGYRFDPFEPELAIVTQLSGSQRSSAWYNARGFDYYEAAEYHLAAAYCAYAAQVEPANAVAHFNTACMLNLIRRQEGYLHYCDYEYLGLVYTHLRRAIALDPQRRQRMVEDPYLAELQSHPAIRLLALDPSRRPEQLLVDVPMWFGPKPGAFPASPRVRFLADGRFYYQEFSIVGREADFAAEQQGYYRWWGRNLLLHYPGAQARLLKARLHWTKHDGAFTDIYIELSNGQVWRLDSDDCSA
jgi:hypothetical protein